MLTLIREISLRHLVSAPLRSLLVLLGISLGVAMLVASQATTEAMLVSFEELVERVTGRADLMVLGNQSGIESSLVGEIAEIEGVEHAAAALEVTTRFVDEERPLLILGVDFLGDTHFLPFRPEKGQKNVVKDPLAFANDPSAVLITKTLAKRKKLKLDSSIQLLTAEGVKAFRVAGILEDSGPAASFGGQVAVMFLDAAQISFARGTLVDRIDIAVGDEVSIEKVMERVSRVVGDQARVERPEQMGERVRALSEPLRAGLGLSGLIALLVGMFIIYNAIGIAVTQRRKEVGLLRSLGVTRRAVVIHFCLEATLLAIPGSIVGLLLAMRLLVYTHAQTAETINRLYVATPAVPHITGVHMVQGALAGLMISVMAAFIPARRGAAMDPVHALRPSAVLAPASSVPYRMLGVMGLLLLGFSWIPATLWPRVGGALAIVFSVCGSALIAPAVVVLLRRILVSGAEAVLGIAGRLGLDNVERNLGRSSINVLALMVAVSMSVSVSGWLASFERSLKSWFEQLTAADLTVTAGSPFVDRRHVALKPDCLARIEEVDGVDQAQPFRVIEQRVGDKIVSLIAGDTESFLRQARRKDRMWKILDGSDPIDPQELVSGPLVVLGENASRKLKLKAGDSISLPSPTGVHDFTVRAVVVDYSSEHGAVFMDRSFYLERWKDSALDAVNVYLDDGVDASLVADRVREKLGGGEALFVTRTSDLKDQLLALLEKSFSYSRSLELIVLVIALMGVIGTMVSAVLDRMREIGMIRAIGATRAQLLRSLIVEAAFLGFCAAVGGVAVGAFQTVLFLETLGVEQLGWHLDYVFPLSGALRISLLVIATSAAAGILPGLRAARMEIRDALAYE
jgi:putative ABC transport system permease protein